MAERHLASDVRPGNPFHDILDFTSCGLQISARADIGAVELLLRDDVGGDVTIWLASGQAMLVAQRLICACADLDDGDQL
jgi:hypothetical protein